MRKKEKGERTDLKSAAAKDHGRPDRGWTNPGRQRQKDRQDCLRHVREGEEQRRKAAAPKKR